MHRVGQKQKGFTIVELLIVVVIIAILAAVTVIGYVGITERSRDARLKSATAQASKEIELYKVTATSNPYPAANTQLKACQSQGLVCDYTRTDYVEVESGEAVYGYALLVCDGNGDIQYALDSSRTSPRKVLNANELVPRINNQYNLFTSNSMSVNYYGQGTPVGSIYGYTGQAVAMTVALRPCTSSSKTTYQWQSRASSTATWANIAGATGISYTTPSLNSSYDGRQYRVVLSNQYGSTSSGYGGMIIDFEP